MALPFKGITVIDLSWVIAGPLATQMLNKLGARIIKIESASRMDAVRTDCRRDEKNHPEEGGWLYQQLNNGKENISLNLKKEKGWEAFEGLIKRADIVVSNYSTAAFRKLGLTYEELSKINPSIIVLNASGMGFTGPYSDYVMFAPPLQAISGIAGCVGYEEDEAPLEEYLPLTDYIGALTIANMLLAALMYRRKTGKGQFIDLSQCESAVAFLGPVILDNQVNHKNHRQTGNHHYSGYAVPHNAYRCKGDQRWCVIAAAGQEEWRRLCEVIDPEGQWCQDEKFSTAQKRLENQVELDARITQWTIQYTPHEVGNLLQAHHVSAAPVQTRMKFLYQDEHIKDRNFLKKQALPELENGIEFLIQQPVARFKEQPMEENPPAGPFIGQDTEKILKEMLHLSDKWLKEARGEGAIDF